MKRTRKSTGTLEDIESVRKNHVFLLILLLLVVVVVVLLLYYKTAYTHPYYFYSRHTLPIRTSIHPQSIVRMQLPQPEQHQLLPPALSTSQ